MEPLRNLIIKTATKLGAPVLSVLFVLIGMGLTISLLLKAHLLFLVVLFVGLALIYQMWDDLG